MAELSRKKQIYFILIGASLILVVLCLGVAFPLFKKIQKTGEEIKNEKALLALIGEQKGYYYRLSNDYAEFKKEFDLIPTPFLEPDPSKAVLFVELLENTAAGLNLQLDFKGFEGVGIPKEDIKKIKAAASEFFALEKPVDELKEDAPRQKEEKGKEEIPFLIYKINLKGEFADMVKFLINLENLQYYSQIDSMQIRLIKIAKQVVLPPAESGGARSESFQPELLEKIETSIEGRVYLDPTLKK